MLTHTLMRSLIMPVSFLVTLVLVRALLSAPAMLHNDRRDAASNYAPGRVVRLLADHGCWTGKAPKGVTIPGHVVLTLRTGEQARYLGARWVGLALEQQFAGADRGIYEVNGFCR